MMSSSTSDDTPERVYDWTEQQKQAIRQQAFDRIETPYVAGILLKLSRAIWDTYSLHTMDSEDLECGTRLSMCEGIQKALWPENGRAVGPPPILMYKNPTTYIKRRMLNFLDKGTFDEGQVTAGGSALEQNWNGGDSPRGRNILSDDTDADGYDGGASAPPAEEILDDAGDPTASSAHEKPTRTEKWHRPHPRWGDGEEGIARLMKTWRGTDREEMVKALEWMPNLTRRERRIMVARYVKWKKTRDGNWRPSVSIAKVAEKFDQSESAMRREIEGILEKLRGDERNGEFAGLHR